VQIDFRRSLNDEEMVEWARLVELVNQTTLTEGRDVMKWVLEKRGNYTTRSLYKAMTFGGVKDPVLMRIWRCRIPLKIKFFLWMAFNDRIQAAVQLKKKKWSGQEECKLCGERETVDHILFLCPVALFMWTLIRETCGLTRAPTSCAELADILLLVRVLNFGPILFFFVQVLCGRSGRRGMRLCLRTNI